MKHSYKYLSRRLALLLMALFVCSFTLTGCGSGGGSDDYEEPASTDTSPIDGAATDVLVDSSQLASWIQGGQVEASASSFDRKVVIIDLNTTDDVTTYERIKGACLVNLGAELTGTRFEGVGDAAPMVATGEQIDAVIQRLGIDENTTIVFTAPGSPYYQTRAYWTFRYWGFSTDQLKLLNGGTPAFAAEYPELMTTAVPSPEPSSFSVRDLNVLNDDLRASVGELIEIVKDLPNSTENMVFDARGDKFYLGNGATSGKLGGDVVVVDGHPEGGEYLSWSSLFEDGKFKSAEEIRALFEAKASFSEDKKATVYCTSGYSATPLFFALEAILGVDVQLHDGSWSQFGKYSDFAEAGGELPPGSPWAIDRYLDPDTYVYNKGMWEAPLDIETLDIASAEAPQLTPFVGDNPADDSDVVQSQVEAADQAYAAGGGGVSFAAPVATATDSVLIDRATLEGWMDDGLVNAETGEKVVLLDVSTTDSYDAGHIPGAQFWNISGQAITRTEGPAPAVNMVLDGETMDERIQAAGIDADTTVVITSSATHTFFPSRAYFLFRYWGFPKERIKVLNGYNAAWPAQDLVSTSTDLPDSTLSVADFNSGAQLDTRVALAELMDAARDDRGTAIDFRGDKAAAGSTNGVYGGGHVVFEGRLNNGTYYSFASFNEDYAAGDFRYKSQSEIASEMAAAGIDVSQFSSDGSYSNPIYSYCRTGYIASTGFFVMDAIMGLDVMTYDGSWSQWGKMSANEDKGGELASGDEDYSDWRTDTSEYMSIINYNVDNFKKVEPLNPDSDALNLHPGDTAANQVEEEDFDYQIQAGDTSSDSDSGDAPDAGGGTPIGC